MKIVKKKLKISPNVLIEDMIGEYPQLIDFLISEYEFYCVNCVMAGFESLKEGAEAHGIIGKDFKKMLARINDLINQPLPKVMI